MRGLTHTACMHAYIANNYIIIILIQCMYLQLTVEEHQTEKTSWPTY